MKERVDFVLERRSGTMTMAALCRAFGISRQTGYKWLARFNDRKRVGDLRDRSRRPHSHPRTTSARMQAHVIRLKQKYPTLGPRKLRVFLEQVGYADSVPSASTIGGILQRHGLVRTRRRRLHRAPRTQPFASCHAPNEVWCVDFKGDFVVGTDDRCWPLTIMDAYSRFLLCCDGLRNPDGKSVRRAFTRVFHRYGLPRAIRCDNGTPFIAYEAPAGLSQLSAWWVELGIRVEPIDPGKPAQNGRHERMHRTLKEATASPPARNLRDQQRAFDTFRRFYNQRRPHEALGQTPPRDHYQRSSRPLPRRLPRFEYPFCETRVVGRDGKVSWGKGRFFVTNSLAGKTVAFDAIDDRYCEVSFGPLTLGLLDREQRHRGLIRKRVDGRSEKLSAMFPV
jgi:transposase InsO family protein